MNRKDSETPEDRDAMIQQAFLNLSRGQEIDSAQIEQLQAIIRQMADNDPAAVANLIRQWLGEEE